MIFFGTRFEFELKRNRCSYVTGSPIIRNVPVLRFEVCTRSPTSLEGRPSCRVASTGYFQVHSLGSSGVFCQVSKTTNHDPRIPRTKAWVRNTLEKMFLQLEIQLIPRPTQSQGPLLSSCVASGVGRPGLLATAPSSTKAIATHHVSRSCSYSELALVH